MNLADIRKKAQQEKEEKAVRPFAEEAPPRVVEPQELVPSACFTSEPPQEASPRSPSAMPRIPQFDPLAVLLAGRAIAGCDEDAPADEAPEDDAAVDDFQEFLCFRVSDELYAISIMEIKEIIKPREITEVPRVPSFISGILSLRGLIIPVFNMHQRLGLEANGQRGKERIVVVKNGEEFSGLLVDEVVQVVRVAEESIEQPPAVLEGIDRDFVQGVGRYDGRMLILLNLHNILDLNLC